MINKAIAAFLLCAGIAGASAQTPEPAENPKGPANCRIALPYVASEFRDCSPQTAAAYDFAFCSVNYQLAYLAVKAAGGNDQSDLLRAKGVVYSKISEMLSDAATLEKNISLTKDFYLSLNGKDRQIGLAMDYVRQKCGNIESWHAEVLEPLIPQMRNRPAENR